MGGASAIPAVKQCNFILYFEDKDIPRDKYGRPVRLTDAIRKVGIHTILCGIQIWERDFEVRGYKLIGIRKANKRQFAANYEIQVDEYFKRMGIYDKNKSYTSYEFRWNMLKDWDEYWEDTLYV